MDEKEKDQILESLLKDNPGAEVPQEVEIRLRRHLATLRERMDTLKGAERFARDFGWGLVLKYTTPVVVLFLIGFIGYLIMAGGAQRAYAEVVEQLRKARSLTYTMTQRVEGSPMPEISTEYVFKEPHYIRTSMPMGIYAVINFAEMKSLTVLTPQKQYIENDFSDTMSEEFKESDIAMAVDSYFGIRSLPERADEVLEEREINGRNVRGFQVRETETGMDKTLWIDVETGDLVRMEGEFFNAPGTHIVIENVRFDIEYDDSFFSLEPPSGFTPLIVETDSSLFGEQDLINMLDFYTSHHVDASFPESLNSNEVSLSMVNLTKSGKFRELVTEGMTEEDQLKMTMETSGMLTRGFMFLLPLEPQNWHYAGKGVKRGDADTPVFWYKPNGSETYRVVYGDLSVRDVAPEDLPPVPAE
jgi:outer membrane lipoprotein-sorting protein